MQTAFLFTVVVVSRAGMMEVRSSAAAEKDGKEASAVQRTYLWCFALSVGFRYAI